MNQLPEVFTWLLPESKEWVVNHCRFLPATSAIGIRQNWGLKRLDSVPMILETPKSAGLAEDPEDLRIFRSLI